MLDKATKFILAVLIFVAVLVWANSIFNASKPDNSGSDNSGLGNSGSEKVGTIKAATPVASPFQSASPKPIKYTVYPIIIYDILLGGVDGMGVWLRADDVSKNIKAGTVYTVYGSSQIITHSKGSRMERDDQAGAEWVKLDFKGQYEFATTATWNLFPRNITEKKNDNQAVAKIVSNYLKKQRMDVKNPIICKVLQADLENDGNVETIVEARNFNIDNIYGMNSLGKYSLILVSRGNKVLKCLQVFAGTMDNGVINYSKLVGAADLNNDGLIEIIAKGGYYEGFGYNVYEPIHYIVRLDNAWGA